MIFVNVRLEMMDFSLRSLLDMVMMIKEFIRALLSQKAIIASKEDEKKNREGVQSLSSSLLPKRSILFYAFTNNVFIAFFLTDD